MIGVESGLSARRGWSIGEREKRLDATARGGVGARPGVPR